MSTAAVATTGVSHNKSYNSFNFSNQYNKLLNKVDTFAKKMGLDLSTIQLMITPLDNSGACGTHCISHKSKKSISNIIYVPFLFLIDPNNIPSDLRINSSADKRIHNPEFRKKATGWINQLLKEKQTKPATETEAMQFLVSASNPDLYNKSIEFVLAHELAHACESRKEEKPQSCWKKAAHTIRAVWANWIAPGIAASFFGASGQILTITGTVFAITGVLLPRFIAAGLACLAIARLIQKNNHAFFPSPEVAEEKKADLDATAALDGNISGAEYYFTNTLAYHRALCRRNPLYNIIIDAQGNNLQDTGHPLLTERIAYLRAWKARRTAQA